MKYFTKETVVYMDGRFITATEAQGNLYSQTLHYGHGAFEGIRSYATSECTFLFKAAEHYERLKRSCTLLHIPFAFETDVLIKATEELLKRNDIKDAYIRPLVFTDPNMSLSKPAASHIFIAAWSWGTYFSNTLLCLCTSSFRRPDPRSVPIEAKACGYYVNSILATIEAKERGFDEALLLDVNGFVAEGPGANIFMEKDGQLYTPPPGNILPGITRASILEICAQKGISCTERLFTVDELKEADSAFYCGTAAEVTGIEQIDNYTFPVTWGASLGKRIQDAYSQRVRQITTEKSKHAL